MSSMDLYSGRRRYSTGTLAASQIIKNNNDNSSSKNNNNSSNNATFDLSSNGRRARTRLSATMISPVSEMSSSSTPSSSSLSPSNQLKQQKQQKLRPDQNNDTATTNANTVDDENSPTAPAATNTMTVYINVEMLRFVSYICFWFMTAFAVLTTKYITAPRLLKGPDPNNPYGKCPPFTGTRENGFDIKTDSHLMESFGFNNVCVNWDYSPSREMTAFVYMSFEYTYVLYVIFEHVLITLSHQRKFISDWLFHFLRFFTIIQIILVGGFRMIFVNLAYVNVQGHTAGFLGFQLALLLTAVSNTVYIIETKVSYAFLGGVEGTRIFAKTYLYVNLIICITKIYLTVYVVFGIGLNNEENPSIYPLWAKQPYFFGYFKIGRTVDSLWMLSNSIYPLLASWVRSRSESYLEITLGVNPTKRQGTEKANSTIDSTTVDGSTKTTAIETRNDNIKDKRKEFKRSLPQRKSLTRGIVGRGRGAGRRSRRHEKKEEDDKKDDDDNPITGGGNGTNDDGTSTINEELVPLTSSTDV